MGLRGIFQPPGCGSGFAAFEAAVDVLSDAQVHPSGESGLVPHVVLMMVPFHTQEAHK